MASDTGDELIDEDLIYDDCDEVCDIDEEEEQALLAGGAQNVEGLSYNTLTEIEEDDVGLHIAEENEEYIEEYQEEPDAEIHQDSILHELDGRHVVEEHGEGEEEEEEEDGPAEDRGRDRFKSERIKISLTDSKRGDNIPDSLDDVKTIRIANHPKFRRGRGGYNLRGQNFQPRHNNIGIRMMGARPLLQNPFPQHQMQQPHPNGPFEPQFYGMQMGPPRTMSPFRGVWPPRHPANPPLQRPLMAPNNFAPRPLLPPPRTPPQPILNWNGSRMGSPQIRDPGYVSFTAISQSAGRPWQGTKRQTHNQSSSGPYKKQMRIGGPNSGQQGNSSPKAPVFSRLSRGVEQVNQNPNLKTIQTVDLKPTSSNSEEKPVISESATPTVNSQNAPKSEPLEMKFSDTGDEEYKKKLEEQQRKRAEFLAKKALRRREMTAAAKSDETAAKNPAMVEKEGLAAKNAASQSPSVDSNDRRRDLQLNKEMPHNTIKKMVSTGSSSYANQGMQKPNLNFPRPRMTRPLQRQNKMGHPQRFPHQRLTARVDTSHPPPTASNFNQNICTPMQPPPHSNEFSSPPPPIGQVKRRPLPIRTGVPQRPQLKNRPIVPMNRPPNAHQRMRAPPPRNIPPLNRPPPPIPAPGTSSRLRVPPPNIGSRPRQSNLMNHPPPPSLENSRNIFSQNLNEPPPPLDYTPIYSHPPPSGGSIAQFHHEEKSRNQFSRPPPIHHPPPHNIGQQNPPAASSESSLNVPTMDSTNYDSTYDENYEAYPSECYDGEGYVYGDEAYDYSYQNDSLNSGSYIESNNQYEKPMVDTVGNVEKRQLNPPRTELRNRLNHKVKIRQPQVKIVSPTASSHIVIPVKYLGHENIKQNSISYVTRTTRPPIQNAVKKRYKRITRRNRNGEIISVKKVPIDEEGNVIGPEENEYINEEVKETVMRGQGHIQAPSLSKGPQHMEVRKPVIRRVVTRPSHISSSDASSSNITIVPSSCCVKLSNLPPEITTDELENFAWLDGSGYFEAISYNDTSHECIVKYLHPNNARKFYNKMSRAIINGKTIHACMVSEDESL